LRTIFSQGKGLVGHFTKFVVVSNVENVNSLLTKVKGTLSDFGTTSGAFVKAFEKAYVEESGKYANTFFGGFGVKITGEATIAGAKEVKSVFNVVKAEENGLAEGNLITKSQYGRLRRKTPSNEIRKMVNPEGPKVDPVYGYEANGLEADHIVPMKEIVSMPGFSKLSESQQIEILNLKDNFIGLGKSTNASKGAKNWGDWV